MTIHQLQIEGYRSLRAVCWTPASLNVVIGPNGSGKSNLLQALEMLRHAAMGSLSDTVVRQGGMQALVWDHQTEKRTWTLHAGPLHVPNDPIRPFSRYNLCLRQVGSSSAFRVDEESLEEVASLSGGRATPRNYLHRNSVSATLYDSLDKPCPLEASAIREDEALLSVARGPASLLGPAGNPGLARFRQRLESWAIYEEMTAGRDAKVRQAVVARSEKRLAADGQNLVTVLHTRYSGEREFKSAIDDAMTAAFGTDYQELLFPPAADQRIQMRIRWRSLRTEQPTANLSDGTLRFLMLLAILAQASDAELIAVDEPETGLHPRMLAILAEHAAEAARQCQVVFTTHSRDFLDAFGKQTPVTSICECEEGQTRLRVVDGDALKAFLDRYTLGDLYRAGDLEALP